MPVSIDLLPASTDHVTPWPPFGTNCCPKDAGLYRDPIPPPDMLLGLRGMVVTYPQVATPTLRGLGQCPFCPGPCAGCGCGARRTALSGLGGLRGFAADTVAEATATARRWAEAAGLALPPTPADVLDAVWRLASTERELEVLRSKLRSMRAAGTPLSSSDTNAYKSAADAWYKAAQQTINPILSLISRTSPSTAAVLPRVSRLPGLDEPDRPLPYVPTEAEMAKIRAGDLTGLSGVFGRMVDTVRSRVAGGVRGLGLFGIDDLTVGTLVLIVVGLLAIAAIVVAISVPAHALVQVVASYAAARAAADAADRRRSFYERCLTTGETSSACARQAQDTIEMPPLPPDTSLFNVGAGAVLAAAGVAALGYYFLATPAGRARAGLSGMRRRRAR